MFPSQTNKRDIHLSGGILSLTWDEERKLLFSGSADESIIIWDIGGQKGSAVELHGHRYLVFNLCMGEHPELFLRYLFQDFFKKLLYIPLYYYCIISLFIYLYNLEELF